MEARAASELREGDARDRGSRSEEADPGAARPGAHRGHERCRRLSPGGGMRRKRL